MLAILQKINILINF